MTFEEYKKWWEYCRDKYDEKTFQSCFKANRLFGL